MQNNRLDTADLPAHIGIIMDGNGRWAKQRGLPRKYGHREGAKTFRRIVEHCERIGLRYLTVYAFSTENWKRPKDEVDSIMSLLEQYIDEAFARQKEDQDIRTCFIGDMSALSPILQQKIQRIEALGKDRTGLTVNVALNYGGRDELAHAMRAIAGQVQQGKLDPSDIDEQLISAHLYTGGQPDPDLIIRPSGEERRLFGICIYGCALAGLYAGGPGPRHRDLSRTQPPVWRRLIPPVQTFYPQPGEHIL